MENINSKNYKFITNWYCLSMSFFFYFHNKRGEMEIKHKMKAILENIYKWESRSDFIFGDDDIWNIFNVKVWEL